MVDSIGNNINIKLKGQNIQLNQETLKGVNIGKNTPIFIQKHDSNNDGVISKQEAEALLKELKKAAGNDTLSAREFAKAKLGEKADFSKLESYLAKHSETIQNDDGSTTMIIRQDDGSFSKTTVKGENRVVQNYNADGNIISEQKATPNGSSTATYKYNANGNLISSERINKGTNNNITEKYQNTYKYDEAGHRIASTSVKYDPKGTPLKTVNSTYENNIDGKPTKITTTVTDQKGNRIQAETVENKYDKDGNLSSTTQNVKTKDNTTTTTKNYAADGKTVRSVTQDITNKDGTTTHTEQKHNDNGKLTEKHTIKKDKAGTVISDLTTKAKYAKDGKTLKKMDVTGTKDGNPYSEKLQYDDKGKLKSIDKISYKRGQKLEEHYEGANLENRKNCLPSTQIAYEKDGKTVKEVTTNTFDKDGVLIGSETKDKDGNVIATHDFSKIDGKFDTSYQKGRGDCYLLAGLNAITESESGREALKDTITVGKDPKTGETTYTVHFPGAAKIRENLIKQGVPEDQIDIKDSYTYTESEIHEKAKLAGPKYSTGDKDVLLLEVAYEDFRGDAKADVADLQKVHPNMKDSEAYMQLHAAGGMTQGEADELNGGFTQDAIYLLTGKNSEIYSSRTPGVPSHAPICEVDSDLNMNITGEGFKLTPEQNAKADSMLDRIENDCKDGKLDDYAATISFNVSTQTVNGKVISGGGHAFTISKVEGDKVYIRNPWDPTKEIIMTRDEVKQAATTITLTDIKGNSTENISDNNSNGNTNPIGNNSNNSPQVNLQAGSTFTVPKGQSYTQLLKDALIAQGIEPTTENIKKASKQFQAANRGAVKTYHGSRAEWKGNKYLIADTDVKIPKFEM